MAPVPTVLIEKTFSDIIPRNVDPITPDRAQQWIIRKFK